MEHNEMNPLKTSRFIARFRPGLLVTMAIIAISVLSPRLLNAEGIDWIVAPYFWGAGVERQV